MIRLEIKNSYSTFVGQLPTNANTLIGNCLHYQNDIQHQLASAFFRLKQAKRRGAKGKGDVVKQVKIVQALKDSEHVYLFDTNTQKFPTGLLKIVKKCLAHTKTPYEIADLRVRPKPNQIYKWENKPHPPRYYQKEAIEAAVQVGRGVIEHAVGCHTKGTQVLMYDGSLRKVEEVQQGDSLMGPDSTPRKVLRLIRGVGDLHEVIPVKGDPFTVNSEHVLSLKVLDIRKERLESIGLTYYRKPWSARITVSKKRLFLGNYESEELALESLQEAQMKFGVPTGGVSCRKFLWRASIIWKRRVRNLGFFKTLEEAKEARMQAELKYGILSKRPSDEPNGGFITHNLTVNEILSSCKNFQREAKLYRTEAIHFKPRVKKLPIDPYILGLWLGDGHSRTFCLTTMDETLRDVWITYCEQFEGVSVREIHIGTQDKPNKAKGYYARAAVGSTNYPLSSLRALNLIKNKHIPSEYLLGSKEDRLALLAGLMDSDGHLTHNTFDFLQKSEKLFDGVLFLCRSLGLAAYKKKVRKECINNGVWGTYFRMCISGDTSTIPTRLPRKQATPRGQCKDVLHTGFKIRPVGSGAFYGFELDRDHLYVMGDFTVTHNSGKTLEMAYIVKQLAVRTLVIAPSGGLSAQLAAEFTNWFGKHKAGLITNKQVRDSKELPPIRVMTIQSIAALKKSGDLKHLLKDIDLVIFDEFHLAASRSYTDLQDDLDGVYYKLGFSANFYRNDAKILSLWGVLSTVLHRYTAKQAITDGFLTPMEVVVHELDGINKKAFDLEYTSNYCGGKALLRRIVTIIRGIDLTNEQVLILVKRKATAGALIKRVLDLAKIDSTFISGDDSKEVINEAIRDFNAKKIKVLIGSSVIGTGIDVRAADHFLMCQGQKSPINVIQGAGRLVRKAEGKETCTYHDFSFRGTKYMDQHLKIRLKTLVDNFNPKEISILQT